MFYQNRVEDMQREHKNTIARLLPGVPSSTTHSHHPKAITSNPERKHKNTLARLLTGSPSFATRTHRPKPITPDP